MADERHDVETLVLQAYRRSCSTLDLAISAFLQALHSHRRPSVCTPFPTSLFATEQGEKDFGAAEDAIKEFSKLYVDSGMIGSEILHGSAKCENLLSSLSFKSLKFLQWLLRLRYEVHIVGDPAIQLPREVAGKLYGSQKSAIALSGVLPSYVLKLDESDARASPAFEQQRCQSGSIFAFHGTSAENLHSILRCGLLILSNSSLQRNGAIFGEGIYLSSDPVVALGFSKPGKGWECSHFGQRARYLLVCEVAMGRQVLCSNPAGVSSSKPNGKDLGTYIIVQNCDLVKLRFIFVYMEPSSDRAIQEYAKKEQHQWQGIQAKSWGFQARRINWCKAMIVFYAVLLMGIAILNTRRTPKFPSKLPHRVSRT